MTNRHPHEPTAILGDGRPGNGLANYSRVANENTSYSAEAPRSQFDSRFGTWCDNVSGVRLYEDRANRQMAIKFQNKPSESVYAVLNGNGYDNRFDSNDLIWYKEITSARPRKTREEAEVLAFKVANMIRKEQDLPTMKAFNVSI